MDRIWRTVWVALVCGGCVDTGARLAAEAYRTGGEDAAVPSAQSCGDGVVAAGEECDPESPAWSVGCDETCKRVEYKPCEQSEECAGANDNCAGYAATSAQSFCATLCLDDEGCPVLPGYASACNFAWCAVLCGSEGECPNGMSCQSAVEFIDREGRSRGMRDVCVIAL
jgi:cysteine-rich repeat protein